MITEENFNANTFRGKAAATVAALAERCEVDVKVAVDSAASACVAYSLE